MTHDDLHEEAIRAIRKCGDAPPTSTLGKMRERAKQRISKSHIVTVTEAELRVLEETPRAPVKLPRFANTDPDETQKPDYAD